MTQEQVACSNLVQHNVHSQQTQGLRRHVACACFFCCRSIPTNNAHRCILKHDIAAKQQHIPDTPDTQPTSGGYLDAQCRAHCGPRIAGNVPCARPES
eukprot:1140878-Pelagomonas_calceolata.AAC.10